jgi:CubicO group peptidase (beta-lactamase class C family)
MRTTVGSTLAVVVLALVTACGGGSESSSTSPATADSTAGPVATAADPADSTADTASDAASVSPPEPAGDDTDASVEPVVSGGDGGTPRDFTELDLTIDDFVADRGLEGAGFVVVDRDDGVVHEHYAGTFSADRVSLVASSSKAVSAGVLMRLHEDGMLDIDAPVADVVGWGVGNPDITPAQLVSSSSGLVGLGPDLGYAPYACQWSPDDSLQACGEEIFTTTEDDDDVIDPDTSFRYGGGQWQVAGAVAEAASGRSWDELIEEIYVEPCGLDVLGYANPYADVPDAGFVYPSWLADDPGRLEETRNPNIEAGMYATPGDYAALLLMHLRGGRCEDEQVLSPDAIDRLHADRIGEVYGGSAGALGGYGMGWWVDRTTGRIRDDGAFGSVPWLDLDGGYGAYLVIEANSLTGAELAEMLFEPLDAIMTAGG